MRLEQDIDFTTLGWVKRELDETLKQSRLALEAYVEDPQDASQMRFCATYLHQVAGTLRMVELHGAAMVAEEMEHVAQALLDEEIEQRDEAYTVLMRGMMQMPDYLERLQSGQRDVPVVLLPLLNDMRASRGEQALPEAVMFAPDLGAELPPQAPGAETRSDVQTQQREVGQLRRRFEVTLLAWLRGRGGDDQASLAKMSEVLDAIASQCHSITGRRLWWISTGVLEGLQNGALAEHETAIRKLLGRVDRAIKQLLDGGELALARGDAEELARQMLYYVAHAGGDGARLEALRETYHLDELVPSEQELERAQGAMSGHNRALLDTVAGAIKEDLLRVKDALDLFLRRKDAEPERLADQVEVLDRVGDTLGMLGLTTPRRIVNEQQALIEDVVAGERAPDEDVLLDVAGALLYVEDSLDDHINRLGMQSGDESDPGALSETEARNVLSALMAEAAVNLGKVKDDILGFVESPWDHQLVEQIPGLLDEIAGALRMLDVEQPAELMTAIGRFVHNELVIERRVPTTEQMDKLADALASIEYYLEAAHEHRRGRESILQVTRDSLDSLGYWPAPEALQTPSAAGDVETTGSQAQDEDHVGTDLDLMPGGDIERYLESVGRDQDEDAGSEFAPEQEAESRDEADSRDSSESDELSEPVSMLPGRSLDDLIVGGAESEDVPGADLAGMRLAETEATMPPDTGDEEDWVEIEEEVEQQVPVDEDVSDAGFQEVSNDIDEDIREVFVEEVEEEIASLQSSLHTWRGDPETLDALTPVRRSFHTLKGSGRLVGAQVIGEFSWKIENMLNRVLDHSIQPDTAVQTVVEHAIGALPSLLASLKGESSARPPLNAISRAADELTEGREPDLEAITHPRMHTVKRTIKRRIPRAEIDAVDVPVDTLHDIEVDESGMAEAEAAQAGDMADSALPEPVLPPVDPVLLDILRSEATQHVASIREFLDARGGTDEALVSEPLLRAVHTLSGAIVMVDISVLSDVLAPMETYLKRVRAVGNPLSSEGLIALSETTVLVESVMAQFDSDSPQVPDSSSLRERIVALSEALPEPSIAHPLFDHDEEHGEFDRDEFDRDEYAGIKTDAADSETGSEADVADADEVDTNAQELAGEPEPGEDEELTAQVADAPPAGDGEESEPSAFAADLEQTGAAEAFEPPASVDEEMADEGATDADVDLEESGMTEASTPIESEDASELETLEPTELEDELDDLEASQEETGEAGAAGTTDSPLADQPDAGDAEEESETTQPLVDEVSDEAFGTAQDRDDLEAGETIADDMEDVDAQADEGSLAPLGEPGDGKESEADEYLTHDEETGAEEAREEEPAEEAPGAEEQGAEEELGEEQETFAESATEAISSGLASYAIAEDAQPEGALDIPDLDPDLLEIFVQEARDLLDHCDGLMARLRQKPDNLNIVAELQRDLHTLKGGARMAGLAAIGDLGHVMESLLETIADGKRTVDVVTVESLEQGFDRLHMLVQRVSQGEAIAMPEQAIERFRKLTAGEPIAGTEGGVETESEPQAEETSAVEPAPARRKRAPTRMDAEPETEARSPQELIRVRSDLLDSLVNYAGEVSIYRSRLEQQNSTFRFNLVEFEQTVARLRDQLRKLEIETEAQIIARYQREHHEIGQVAFDPLELDRFSQLQQYSRALAESVSDLVSIQGLLDDLTSQSETLLLQQSRVNSDLQEGLMRTRMVPFESMVPSLRRTLRQAAQEMDKRAQMKVVGAQGEMDRNLLERMKAPFEHMLRNAMVHGVESPEQRVEAGKPVEGTVLIEVSRDANEVVITVSDDGAGIDRAAIRAKAIERGLMKPDAQLSDRDLYGFILETGFSTAKEITQLAGRGVGLDVVNAEIKQLGGSLAIDSEQDTGTTFTIRLPFTLAVTQAILVRIGEATYAVPMTSVQGVARIAREDLDRRMAEGEPSYSYTGESYAIHDLGQLLGMPVGHRGDDPQLPMLMTRSGDQRAAVRIDSVIGSREVVVKSVGPQISSVPGIFGATIMGDGSVVIILDLAPLVRRSTALQLPLEESTPAGHDEADVPVADTRQRPVVMVVDDSITMRKVTTRILERQDIEVITAKDGMDAVEKLQERVPDAMLLDIEMPRMDGYELATYMKNDARLSAVPIIMITSRTGEKHRERALELGVERYLGKPYQEGDLLAQVRNALETSRV